MKKALLIAEKSSLMNEIKEVYNKHKIEFDFDIKFTNQSGHLVRLLNPSEMDEEQKQWRWESIPFHPEQNGGWQYVVIAGKEKLYQNIKTEIMSKNYDFIIHAGDPEQEGELLINLVLNKIGCKLPIYRFWSNDLTEKAIISALKTMGDDRTTPLYKNLYTAAIARQHSDYRIGMNGSRACSLKMGGTCATGRVKAVILAITAKRENEIKNFKPTTTYAIQAVYGDNFTGILFDDQINLKEGDNPDIAEVRFKTKQEATAFISTLSDKAKVIFYDKKQTKQYAPSLFKLATLQTEAGKLGYNSDKVLEIVQSLYEKKFVSYPRTSCEYLSSKLDFIGMIKSVLCIPEYRPFIQKISRTDIERVRNSSKWINDKELENSGHYALSPTTNAPDISRLSSDELTIYKLIVRQFIAIFLPPVIQERTMVITENNGNKFRTAGKVLIDAGYAAIFGLNFKDLVLPPLKDNQIIQVREVREVGKTTVCPKFYTDGELIAVLENPVKFLNDPSLKSLGKRLTIGTPATRDAIIKELIDRKYLERRRGKGKAETIHVTELGMLINRNLGDREICRVDMSGLWEEKLELIRQGVLKLEDFEKEMITYTNNMVLDIKNAPNMEQMPNSGKQKNKEVGKCPACGGEILKGKGYYCSGYKNGCQVRFPLEMCGARFSEIDIKAILQGKEIVKQMTKNESTWKQALRYDKSKQGLAFVK